MYKYHSLKFMADRMCDDENIKKRKNKTERKRDKRKKILTLNKTILLLSTDRSQSDHDRV